MVKKQDLISFISGIPKDWKVPSQTRRMALELLAALEEDTIPSDNDSFWALLLKNHSKFAIRYVDKPSFYRADSFIVDCASIMQTINDYSRRTYWPYWEKGDIMAHPPITTDEQLRVINYVMRRYIFGLTGQDIERPYATFGKVHPLNHEKRLLFRDLVREYQERENEICDQLLHDLETGGR